MNAFVSHLTSIYDSPDRPHCTQSTIHHINNVNNSRCTLLYTYYVYTTLYTYCDNMNNVYIRGGHLSVRLKVVSIY